MKYLYCSIVLIFSFSFCTSAQKPYKKVPASLMPERYQETAIKTIEAEARKNSVQIASFLPANYVKNGTVDYTNIVQRVLDNNRSVIFPDFPLLISDKGLTIKSNSNLIFNNNSKLILKSSDKERYELIRVHNVSNVNIFSPNLIGDRKSHIGTKGEWGMGIAVRVSNNIAIYNPVISDFWGDGIYVGSNTGLVNGKKTLLGPSKDIKIYNAFLDNNRRNGLSIVSVDGLVVYNSVMANTQGTAPKAGVDIEPYYSVDVIKNVNITNLITYNNSGSGLIISLRGIAKGALKKDVNITIDGHKDVNSAFGLRLAGYRTGNVAGKAAAKQLNQKLGGSVVVKNSNWKMNPYGSLVIENNQSMAPSIQFINNSLQQKKGSSILKGKDLMKSSYVKKGLEGNASINFK